MTSIRNGATKDLWEIPFRSSAMIVAIAPLIVASALPARGQAIPREAPPYIPTPGTIVDLMLDMARVGPGDLVYDLGSGDGRLVIAAAARGARAVGVEYDGSLVEASRAVAEAAGLSARVRFVEGDIFETPFADADVVMLYLSPEFNLRLRPRLLSELRPGTRVVSHAFHMGDWSPDTTRTIGAGAERATVFAWIVPARVDGFWLVDATATAPFRLELVQEFQRLTGSARLDDMEVPIVGSLKGDRVEIEIQTDDSNPIVFEGKVADGRIAGVVNDGMGAPRPAVAVRFSDPSRAPTAERTSPPTDE